MKENCALIIAGTDPTGGAGIVRDIAALEFFSVKPAIAITAINVQNDKSVQHIELTTANLLRAQINCALQAKTIKAIKIGMLGSIENIEAINKTLENYTGPIVLDPVLAASSGYLLGPSNMSTIISKLLLPKISLLTPNLPELSIFAQAPLSTTLEQAIEQGEHLMQTYALQALLIKGGHLENCTEAIDVLLRRDCTPQYFKNRLLAKQMRGTGCALSSAIAALLANGYRLGEAVNMAKKYVYKLIDNC